MLFPTPLSQKITTIIMVGVFFFWSRWCFTQGLAIGYYGTDNRIVIWAVKTFVTPGSNPLPSRAMRPFSLKRS